MAETFRCYFHEMETNKGSIRGKIIKTTQQSRDTVLLIDKKLVTLNYHAGLCSLIVGFVTDGSSQIYEKQHTSVA